MTLRLFFLIVLSISLAAVCTSANNHIWSHRFGDTDEDLGVDVTTDASGNVLVTGGFIGTVDFGGGVLTSAGDGDIFVAKYSFNGTHIWSRRFGNSGEDWGDAVAVDASGNVLVTGAFNGAVDFGGGVLTSAGGRDIFLAKFDSDGNHIWSLRRGDTLSDGCHGAAVDGDGSVIITGWFDSGSGGSDFILLAKYNSSGSELWSKNFTDPDEDTGIDVAADNADNVFITGYFQNSADFGGGVLTSAGAEDIFLAKYDPVGNHIWSQRFGGTGSDWGRGIETDSANNVLMTGGFSDTACVGGDSLISKGSSDIFVAKYNASGDHLWSHSFGGDYEDGGSNIAADCTNNVIVTGIFRDSVDFGGGSLMSAGSSDIFVAKYDLAGNHLWSQSFGDVDADMSYSVAADAASNIIITGYFTYVVDFGGGPLTSAGNIDIFLAKFGPRITGLADLPHSNGIVAYSYPNPFNPMTTIAILLPEKAYATIRIYDIKGRAVATLYDDMMDKGLNEVNWDGTNFRGDKVSSGVYFYSLIVGNRTLTKKMVLLK